MSCRIAKRLRSLRQHGMTVPDTAPASQRAVRGGREVDHSDRMTDIQAAVGILQLQRAINAAAGR